MGLLMLAAILFWVLPHARAVRYRMEAIRLAGQGRLDRSCVTVNRAIAIEPANPAYWTTLADALKIRGQDQQALEAYKRAAVLGEDLAPYHFRLAAHSWRVSTDASNPALAASAIGELRKAIRCNPHDIDYHLLLGYWLETTGEKREALKEYRVGLELISAALERPEKIRRHSPAEYERLNLLVRERIAKLSEDD
jgi:tetratricopeptide (TPR) repeat protein